MAAHLAPDLTSLFHYHERRSLPKICCSFKSGSASFNIEGIYA
uniref:Uncharacterized protein n=1 Tax=Arundo donax TaxID=35708 RepID=A0A0A9LXD1_ARUDO